MMTLFVHEFPGPALRFARDIPVSEPGRVVDAIGAVYSAFAPMMVPLAIEVELAVFEPELGIRRYDVTVTDSHRTLIVRDLATGIAPPPSAGPVTLVDQLTPPNVCRWLVDVLAGHDDLCVGLAELRTTASEGRAIGAEEPVLRTRAGDKAIPTRLEQGHLWLAGPIVATPSQPPLRVIVHHDLNQLMLTVGVEWSWWTGGPGRSDLDQVCRDVVSLGWAPR